jgi:hypothetical protein
MSVGTSIFGMSPRKSVYHAVTQSSEPLAEAPTATFQLSWMAWSLMRFPPSWSVIRRLEQERRHAGEEHRFPYAIRAVRAKVAGYLTCSHREAHQRDITQVERGQQLVQVLGQGVIFVTDGGLARPAEPAPVIRDDSVARGEECRDLLLPGCPAEGPAVDQHDWLAGAVVFVVELDGGGILLAHRDVASLFLRDRGIHRRLLGDTTCVVKSKRSGNRTPTGKGGCGTANREIAA